MTSVASLHTEVPQPYLDVCGVLVRLVRCCLELFTDPCLNFIHIPTELLQGLRFAQFGAFFDHLGLQPPPPLKHHSQVIHECSFTQTNVQITQMFLFIQI